MATSGSGEKLCCKCNKDRETVICDGSEKLFCSEHIAEHRQELSQQLEDIGQKHDILQRELGQQNINPSLSTKINQWKTESISNIQSTAKKALHDLKKLTEESNNKLLKLMNKLSDEICSSRGTDHYTENDLNRWMKQLEKYRNKFEKPAVLEISEGNIPSLHFIKIEKADVIEKAKIDPLPQITSNAEERQRDDTESSTTSSGRHSATRQSKSSRRKTTPSPSQLYSYPGVICGPDTSSHRDIYQIFENLKTLSPMDKNGPMSGNCEYQTAQMERFLSQTFAFNNLDEQYIVQGVKSFGLDKPPHLMDPDTIIHFPSNQSDSFAMTVEEIIKWQHSYAVYADKNAEGMSKEFLCQALQGQSKAGEEAFLMKFVVRVSQCPILMEFDAHLISRLPKEQWPHMIKLVSVTGIDFAGRKHDVSDITTYVLNWRDIFETNPKTGNLVVSNGRDFCPKSDAPKVKLDKNRLRNDLMCMARLRLRACDAEGVEIVVETGIGLGVFAGKHIGIDGKVRELSASATRTVLEQDGPSYRTIRGIVFALPVFDDGRRTDRIEDTYQAFVDEFEGKKYNGPIPVLITDQDMHRVTVAVARQGFTVSELNPADSHGVFGEYWQNRGPAVEEKLALTTLGLLVQHHLINPHVLDRKNYHLLQLKTDKDV